MTLTPEALAVLGLVVAAGLAYIVAKGGMLAKVSAVVVGLYMVGHAAGWAAADGQVHSFTAGHGLALVATLGAGVAVVRFASWLIVPAMVLGLVIVAGAGLGDLAGAIA